VAWQLLVAVLDPEHRRDRHRHHFRTLVRLEHLFSGALHTVLVIEAMRILFGFGRGTSGVRTQKEWIVRALEAPLGRYVVGAVGIGIAFYGLYQGYRAVSRNRDNKVDLRRTRFRLVLDLLGIFGLLARGAMFSLIGVYLTRAAWRLQVGYAVGVAGALGSLRQEPYGEWMLGTIAGGLVSYGLWQIAKEPYRRLRES